MKQEDGRASGKSEPIISDVAWLDGVPDGCFHCIRTTKSDAVLRSLGPVVMTTQFSTVRQTNDNEDGTYRSGGLNASEFPTSGGRYFRLKSPLHE